MGAGDNGFQPAKGEEGKQKMMVVVMMMMMMMMI